MVFRPNCPPIKSISASDSDMMRRVVELGKDLSANERVKHAELPIDRQGRALQGVYSSTVCWATASPITRRQIPSPTNRQ